MARTLKPLAPARDDWRVVNDLAGGQRFSRNEGAANRHNLAPLLRGPALAPGGWHPFKIYQVYSSPPAPATDWLLFRVRAGNVMGVNATGTDGTDANPDEEELQAASSSTYITITASCAAFWFWLELGGAAPVVRYAADPASAGTGNPNPWPTYPTPDATHIPIGFVDTLTNVDSKVAVVRQLLRADVVATAGGGTTLMTLISLVDLDQLICRPDGAASDGSQDIQVATDPEVRVTPDGYTETIGGEEWGYGGYTTSTQSRLATRVSDSATEIQVITPRWILGKKVAVFLCSNTGIILEPSGLPIMYICIGNRAWAKQTSS